MAKDPISRYMLHRTSRLERRARLRPMEPSEITDLALRVYQNFGLSMLRSTALPAVFCFAAMAFMVEYALPGLFFTEHAGQTDAQIAEALTSLAIGIAVGGPLFLIGLAYASGVVIHLVSDFVAGRPANEAGAQAAAFRILPRLLLFSIRELLQAWSGILIGFGGIILSAVLANVLPQENLWPAVGTLVAVFGFIAGFFVLPVVLSRHALAPSIIALEGGRVGSAIRRSIDLMKSPYGGPSGYGAMFMLFGIELLLLLMVWIGAGSSLGLVDGFIGLRQIEAWPFVGVLLARTLELLPLFLAVWIIIPVWCTTTTLLYYERRIRLEGYDILALAQEVWRADRQSRFEL